MMCKGNIIHAGETRIEKMMRKGSIIHADETRIEKMMRKENSPWA